MRARAITFRGNSRENNLEAKELYERAVKLDDHNVIALSGLGATNAWLVTYGNSSTPEVDLRNAEDQVARALRIDPRYALAYFAKGLVLRLQGKEDAALVAFEQCAALNPSFAPTYDNIAFQQITLGKAEDAFSWLQKYRRLSPRDPGMSDNHWITGYALLLLGRADEAIPWLEASIAATKHYFPYMIFHI
jgi:tetratricopeptide (TPR) repeat protein